MDEQASDREARIFFGTTFMRSMVAMLIALVILMAAGNALGLNGHARHGSADASGYQLDRIGVYSEAVVVLGVAAFLIVARTVPAYRLRGEQLVCARGLRRPLIITRTMITASRVTPSAVSIFTAGGESVTIWSRFLNPSDAALIIDWLQPVQAAPSPGPADGAAAPVGAGNKRLPLTKDMKFVIVAAAIALSAGLALGIYFFTHEMALLNAQKPFPFNVSFDAKPAAGTPERAPKATMTTAEREALRVAYRSAATPLERTTALLRLVQAIQDTRVITDEDRGVLRDFMGDARTDRDGKICAMLPIIELKDRASIDWLIDVAMAETDVEWRRRVVLCLMIMDRKATAIAVSAKLAHDERYRNVQRIIDDEVAQPK